MNIRIISGTDRPGSNALRIARYLDKMYRKVGANSEIIDLQQFPIVEVEGGKYGKELTGVNLFVQPVLEADGLVLVCPEYNGGYPGILKLFIDYLPFPDSLDKKPICLVGEANGTFGALRAVEQLQQVMGYRNAHIFPERVFIPQVNKNFDEQKGILDPFQQDLLESQIRNFVQYISDLKNVQSITQD